MASLMTSGEVAKFLGLIPETVRAYERRGRLKAAMRTESGMRLFRREDVEALARERAERRAKGQPPVAVA